MTVHARLNNDVREDEQYPILWRGYIIIFTHQPNQRTLISLSLWCRDSHHPGPAFRNLLSTSTYCDSDWRTRSNHGTLSVYCAFLKIDNLTVLISNKMSHIMRKPTKWNVRPAKTQISQMPRLISVFAVRMKKAWVLSYHFSAQWRLWSDWADAQADLSLHWVHMPFSWFCHEAA